MTPRVASGAIDGHFVWQAWRSVPPKVNLCGRCGTYRTGLALMGLCDAAAGTRGILCHRWSLNPWHLVPSTATLCVAVVTRMTSVSLTGPFLLRVAYPAALTDLRFRFCTHGQTCIFFSSHCISLACNFVTAFVFDCE